jgi:hypothetical protein
VAVGAAEVGEALGTAEGAAKEGVAVGTALGDDV